MSTLATRLQDFATRVATQCKTILTLVNGNAADLSALTTTAKGNLVAALNELKGLVDAAATSAAAKAAIDDALATSTSKTYSIDKIRDVVTTAIAAITNGAPAAMDQLNELAAALGNDANFAATIATALAARVRTDTAAQGLTAQQKSNARANIDAYGSGELGNPDTDLVAVFNTGLV